MSVLDTAGSKTCRRCGVTKPASDFAKHTETRDRLQSWCRQCNRENHARNADPDRLRAKADDQGVPHGTHNRYANYACRCDPCREAGTAYTVQQQERRRAQGVKPRKHGLTGHKNYGCDCDVCLSAAAAQRRRLKQSDRPIPDDVHGSNGYNNYGCKCAVCRTAHIAETTEQKRQNARLDAQMNAPKSRERVMWTGPELEMATRDDLTLREIAEALGRTRRAVEEARKRCRELPREQWLAGLTETG